MADGVFNIPMSEYYSKSSEFKTKVSEFVTSVETNFINKVSGNIHLLASEDASVVEGFASYTEAKSKLETLKEYETKLTNMSSEGGSNPLNGVVSLDKQYSGEFSSIGQGLESKDVANAISAIDKNIASEKFIRDLPRMIKEFGKEVKDHDLTKTLLAIAKSNPLKALEKLLKDPKFQVAISQNNKVTSILWNILYKLDEWSRIGKLNKVADAIFDSPAVFKVLEKSPVSIQNKVLNALVRLSDDNAWNFVDFGKKSFDWFSKITELKPVKWLTKVSSSQIGKAITNPFTSLGLSATISAIDDFTDPDSRGYNHVGKAVTGGVVDAIVSIGPLEGMLIGASVGKGWGALIGGVTGGINTLYQWRNPDTKKKVKNWAYDRIDDLGDKKSLTYKVVTTGTSPLTYLFGE